MLKVMATGAGSINQFNVSVSSGEIFCACVKWVRQYAYRSGLSKGRSAESLLALQELSDLLQISTLIQTSQLPQISQMETQPES